ncbi:MAG TPA: excinuclease ABC subunit UvrA [Terriglobales bacterium]|nr:excinuclease ABC subunit UvrA [Terriglobales bacterium]
MAPSLPISPNPGESESIVVRGARVHNLKNIDLEIPHNQLTVVTGVSGSGKSSLAFDTIYAEGQRRYVESLSAYARQFLERIEKPDVDVIDGIAPAIAIRQKNSTRNPRSTVATATEIYDYLRLLYARVGTTFCLQCGGTVKKDTVDEVAETILKLDEGTRMHLLFPVRATAPLPAVEAKPKKRTSQKALQAMEEAQAKAHADNLKGRLFDLRKRGFARLYQDTKIFEFSTPESLLDVDFTQPVYVLVDRLGVAPDIRARLVDGVEIAYREGGEIIFETVPREGEGVRQWLRFSQRFECKKCLLRYEEPEPRLFSFNNPFGACPRCQGFGNTIDFDLDLVIPDKERTLNDGAIEPWTKPKYRPLFTELKRAAKQHDIPMDVPWEELELDQQQVVLEGDGSFPGVHGFFAHLERKKYKLHVRVFLSRYRGYALCPDCKGQRLRPEARTVRISGKNICEAAALTVEDAAKFFAEVKLTREQADIADKILVEVRDRLKFLNNVGLEYLTLDRLSSTLSGGEAQRIQLATSLASRLVGALYVLDEPSIGLHSRDTERLIRILHDLRDLGNTILVVEHDPEVMRASDRILDLGPGAGEHGGKVMAVGTYEELQKSPASLTGRYLAEELRIQMPPARRKPGPQQLKLTNVRAHNLRKVNVSFPLGMLVAITGVSGSGKSTLIHDVLYKALASALGVNAGNSALGTYDKLEGAQFLGDVVLVDQSPIGRTPRSNPVTYIKAFDIIRETFADTPEAAKRGYGAGHFSFNIPGGRCETCQGDGTVTVEMQFLADVELICEECKGTRFKPGVLEVKYKGKNIHEVLNLTVKEALQFFSAVPKLVEKLKVLEEVGLGYLRLGQSATTLSGGEAQRMKLAAHLQPRREFAAARTNNDGGEKNKRTNRTLYIFDEPTTGLHFDDVGKLLFAFRRLLDTGGSIIVIEHNLDVIKTADWVIDLGPDGGIHGGEVMGSGTPEDIARNKKSHTGQWLARILNKNNGNLPSNGRKSKA